MRTTGHAVSPQGWAQCLAQDSLSSIIEMLLQQEDPDEREINLKGQNLNEGQVVTLAQLLNHAECPPLALNLEDAIAPTIGYVLTGAATHKPLTELNLRNLRLVRAGKSTPISPVHVELIAKLLGPDSKLQVLILDGQKLLPTINVDGQTRRPTGGDFSKARKMLKKMLLAVGASATMKTLSLVGCDLFHQDLFVIGNALYPHKKPCTLITLALSKNFQDNFQDTASYCVWNFLSSAARSHCLESLDLGHFVRCNETVDAELLKLVGAVKTLCHVSPCPEGETGTPLEIRLQLEANRHARIASAMETVLCAQLRFVPHELGDLTAGLIFDIQRASAVDVRRGRAAELV
jgi:hypothetical protein